MFTSAPNGMTTILSSPCVASEKTVMVKKTTKNILLFIRVTMVWSRFRVNGQEKKGMIWFLRGGRSAQRGGNLQAHLAGRPSRTPCY